jgi:hypothetical protein
VTSHANGSPALSTRRKLPRHVSGLSLVLSLAALPALGASPLEGTWNVDIKGSQLPKQPIVLRLAAGTYVCETCSPRIEIRADGQDHAVAGSPYYDSVSLSVIDPSHYTEVRKRNGQTVWTIHRELSADNRTMTVKSENLRPGAKEPERATRVLSRLSAASAGAAPLSGEWQLARTEELSANAATITYTVERDVLHMSTPAGTSFGAKLDGTAAPFIGDPGQDSVSVRQVSERVFQETDLYLNAIISTSEIVVSEDGRSAESAWTDHRRHTSGKTRLVKE